MSQTVDGVLKDWGDRIYPRPVVRRRGRNVMGGPALPRPEARKPVTPATARKILSITAGRAPEVLVKISGGGRNIRRVKAHLDYISRNGKVELEDENGMIYNGAKDVREVRDAWRDGPFGIAADSEERREAFNIILSMPPGTNRAAVKNAARRFAAERFSDHQYVFAAHEDEKHPHVHLCVKAVDKSGERLNPRKADLQHWRAHFASRLRDEGIAANATPRRMRGIVRKAESQAVRWMDKEHAGGRRAAPSRATQARKEAVKREQEGRGAQTNPAATAIAKARQDAVRAYGQLARALARSGDADDKRLALSIVGFVKAMPPLQTRHQAELERLRRGGGKQPPGRENER
ncbi:MAG: relaxase/mobilization nuclease domain-containing protein [Candidatus Accumulibacter sp.]|nr:relaxase/mobilization nuclease domain-containing protein [Accumulibacter sp.]